MLGHAVLLEGLQNHPDGNVHGMDLLVVNRHDLVVVVRVVPAMKTLKLPSLPTLPREVRAGLPTIIRGLPELLPGIDIVIKRVRGGRLVGGLEAD